MSIPANLDAENRQDGRRGVILRLPVLGTPASGDAVNVLVHNISAAGMLLESELPLFPGDFIDVDLPHAGPTSASVIWTSDSLYGCRFGTPVSTATLSAAELRGAVGGDITDRPDRQEVEVEDFGSRLRQMRKAKGLTLRELATRLGVSVPAISAWEKGKAFPRDARLKALSEALGRPVSKLFGSEAPQILQELLTKSREQIAGIVGTSPDKIRILIEL